MANTYVLIESKTLGSNTTSVVFSSIPNTYRDLELRMSTRVTSASDSANLKLAFNSDTTDANYASSYTLGSGTTVTATTSLPRWAGVSSTSSNTASVFSANLIYILGYKNTTWRKGYHVKSVSENNASNAYIQAGAGYWTSTSAISSITISFTDNILANSTFNLYGIS